MILIAIGANLPAPGAASPLKTCQAAAASLLLLPSQMLLKGLTFVALSGWYRTESLPSPGQPDFCNGVIRFEGEADPAVLLNACHDVEARFARVREERNAPRTLDLDLIDVNGIIRDSPDPILPHPRAHLRGFVLRPILDVAPGWRHPALRKSVSTLLAELPPQRVEPWDPA